MQVQKSEAAGVPAGSMVSHGTAISHRWDYTLDLSDVTIKDMAPSLLSMRTIQLCIVRCIVNEHWWHQLSMQPLSGEMLAVSRWLTP
jgi:hypothetical protein